MKNFYAIGNGELKHFPRLKKIEKCPSCGKGHKVVAHKDTSGCESGICFLTCSKGKQTYLIGFNGRRILPQKDKS